MGKPSPQLLHPLSGANPATLAKLLASNGAIPLRCWPHVAIAALATLARWPFSTAERIAAAMTLGRGELAHPPVFIVGYWRSGTTHLHNLMSRDPQFGWIPPLATGLPWDLLGIAAVLRPLLVKALPETRFVDNVAVDPDSPQEDSIALANMVPLSYYDGVYFPTRFERHYRRGVFFEHCDEREIEQWRRRHEHLLRKVERSFGGRRLLIKNPVYTAQLHRMRDIWPGAKFVHIYRNPYVVYRSTQHFFSTMFEELALQDSATANVDEMIVEGYVRLLDGMYEQSATLPANDFAEVRYEDLDANPLPELERIYDQLQLDGFGVARRHIEAYLERIQSYRTNRYPETRQTIAAVDKHWHEYVRKWGYAPP